MMDHHNPGLNLNLAFLTLVSWREGSCLLP